MFVGNRFMVDSDVVGCCWIELPKGKYKLREEKKAGETDSQNPGKVISLNYLKDGISNLSNINIKNKIQANNCSF